ncbi:MAG: hypothetical protein DMG11_08795, partial [Acidobacteria bacterium]
GVYQFPSLVPGIYQISAEKEGFKKETHQNLVLEISAKLNLNFQLQLAGVSSQIEVKFILDSTLGTTSTSVGGVINDQRIQDLPLPDRDALGLVLTQGGLFGDNFAGSRISALNVTRDGINIMDQTINLGVNSVFFTSVDSVSEVRVITSPADAELGRGSGQVQILTRSGTNEFHGSIFELHHNSVLNANEWAFNWLGIPRDPLTSNQFGARLDGPIDRNKTFFHMLYEGLRERPHERVTATVLTPQARLGIFRFFPGALNSNADAPNPTVDLAGNPVRPAGATGDLRSINVFASDASRPAMDRTGLVQGILKAMPLPNDYRAGDGLNTAGYTWLRHAPDNRNQIDTRLDHWFNPKNHLAFVFTRETTDSVNSFLPQQYPDSPPDRTAFHTTFYSLSLTSTLNSRLVNEFRAGEQRSKLRFYAPWESEAGLAALPRADGRPYLLVLLCGHSQLDQGQARFQRRRGSAIREREQLHLFRPHASRRLRLRWCSGFGPRQLQYPGPRSERDRGSEPAGRFVGIGGLRPAGFQRNRRQEPGIRRKRDQATDLAAEGVQRILQG